MNNGPGYQQGTRPPEREKPMTQTRTEIRGMTQNLILALELDIWPSPAIRIVFGIETQDHLGALQFALLQDGVSAERLDAALGNGAELQKLISGRNPYRFVTFVPVWDGMPTPEEMLQEQDGSDDPARADAIVERDGPRRSVERYDRQGLVLVVEHSLFSLGNIVATPGALGRLRPSDIQSALSRHAQCEWGEMDEEDRRTNDRSLMTGGGVMSVHVGGTDRERFYVITDPGHAVTTVLLPGEY
jgi:hypothetical protein